MSHQVTTIVHLSLETIGSSPTFQSQEKTSFFHSPPGIVQGAIEVAIKNGYRHIDCAYFYDNEGAIGEAFEKVLKEGLVKREDLFVVSKLWNSYHAPEDVKPALLETLKLLRLDYLDLYLMHSPMGIKNVKGDTLPQKDGKVLQTDVDYVDTWKAMEKLVDEGLVKSIGVANFNQCQLERLLSIARIKPDVLQVERHVYQIQRALIAFTKSKKMALTGYSPLTSPKRPFPPGPLDPKNGMEDPVVKEIAKKHGKSPAQILIRFNIQSGIATIPKSQTPAHIIDNSKVFDFRLTDEEMKKLESLHCGARAVAWDILGMGTHKHYPFTKDE
ncbi:aldo-keto reductase 1B-like isoform X1 [Podarcis muralis]|uniref:1,5-anhydro-D-fructose reductase-like isoform X1 n=1 Tax=Podarcis muralis TaxID=64176 RepID=UPI00109FABF0|nr:1,5-anhydro-D-fructose reductase-like isoform X1 [Podarcis muralis]